MRLHRLSPLIFSIFVLAACGTDTDRQWMKLDQPYTTAEFRRDLASCTKSGTVDEE